MTETRPRWESEMMTTQQPNAQACVTCMLRTYDVDGVTIDSLDASICQIYEYPESKPSAVYFEGAACEYYVEE